MSTSLYKLDWKTKRPSKHTLDAYSCPSPNRDGGSVNETPLQTKACGAAWRPQHRCRRLPAGTQTGKKSRAPSWREAGTKTTGLCPVPSGCHQLWSLVLLNLFSPQSEKRKRQTRLTFRALLLWDYMFFPDRLIWTKYSLEIQKLNKLIQKPNLSLRYKTSLCYSQAALEYTNNTPVRNLCHIHFQRRKSILRQIKSEP